MKAEAVCLPCLQALARRVVRLAASGDGPLEARADAACRTVLEPFRVGVTVPTRLSSPLLRAVRRTCGCDDPFREMKEGEYARSQAAAERLVNAAEPTLEGLLRLSAAGNQIDFFRAADEVARLWEEGLPDFAVDDGAALALALEHGKDVLFLADNLGEVPFDLPLVASLERRGKKVRYAVKGGPSQNDVTRADVERLGIRVPGLLDTGSDSVGCELSEAGPELRRAWDEADAVIAKGMANWETLTEYPEALGEKPVFFLLCAKCGPVASSLAVEPGRAVLASGRRALAELTAR